ncbi:MAG: hypothetical protein ACMXYB_00080 [Candidatus Woesearchaeota archaeon]
MDWELYAWLKRGKRRKEVLEIINSKNKPLSVNDIKNELKIAISQSSFTVKELIDKKLISCLNSEDNIGRLYVITEKGKKLINKI